MLWVIKRCFKLTLNRLLIIGIYVSLYIPPSLCKNSKQKDTSICIERYILDKGIRLTQNMKYNRTELCRLSFIYYTMSRFIFFLLIFLLSETAPVFVGCKEVWVSNMASIIFLYFPKEVHIVFVGAGRPYQTGINTKVNIGLVNVG